MEKKKIIRRKKRESNFVRVLKQMSYNKAAIAGAVILLIEVILAAAAPLIAPYDYNAIDIPSAFQGPSAEHWFGTDDMGRDILSRILIGAKYSMGMGLLATAFGMFMGCIVGAVAGYFGGKVDNIIMRILDVVQSLPSMVLVIVLSALLGAGFFNTILAMSIGGIAGSARMLRAQMLKVRGSEYIEAAQSINCSRFQIVVKHLIPNSFSPMIVQATMGVASTITSAASLSFIGLGIQPPTPEWGAILSASRQFIRSSPYMALFPGLAIAVTVLSLNLMGDGLRDALDPKLKR